MANNIIYIDDESSEYERLQQMNQSQLKMYLYMKAMQPVKRLMEDIRLLKELDFKSFDMEPDGFINGWAIDKELTDVEHDRLIKAVTCHSNIICCLKDKAKVIERLTNDYNNAIEEAAKIKRMRRTIYVSGYWANR